MKKINTDTANAVFKYDKIDVQAEALETGSEVCLKTGAKVYKLENGLYLDGYNYNEGRDLERYFAYLLQR
ncbi:MAG: hypothetical protein QGF59_14120 [Pirellulaceae bacterium]|nr:hypothetical protein [Pirellulaceae bacterium]